MVALAAAFKSCQLFAFLFHSSQGNHLVLFPGGHELHSLGASAVDGDVSHIHADDNAAGGDEHEFLLVMYHLDAHYRAGLIRDLQVDKALGWRLDSRISYSFR